MGSAGVSLEAFDQVVVDGGAQTPPRSHATTLPQGSGSLAIIRSLIHFHHGEEEPNATSLAAQAKVSQPRASQVLARLRKLGLVAKTPASRWIPNREALLDRFLLDYKGPGGSEQYLYSLDPLTDVATRMASLNVASSHFVVSADVGADLIAAWRRPSTMIVYVRAAIDSTQFGLVEAQGSEDANIIIRSPRDTSVFPTPALVVDVRGVEVPLADPTQMIWDLENLGGADRHEAAEVMREWVLTDRP